MVTLNNLSKNRLTYLYEVKRLSTWGIEKRFGYSRSFVYNRLLEYRIPVRSLSASHLKTTRHNFCGSASDRAYLFGFATGDLRIRIHNKGLKCETISIACSSNKLAQIKLIRKLFAPYGHIWQGKPNKRGVVSIEAFVDFSFKFLLGKDWKRFSDRFKTKREFLAFLAGFTDAEGSIFISRKQACFSLGNYDADILNYIKTNLSKINIKTGSLICDNLKGYVGEDGYVRSADYYKICCTEKRSLEKLLKLLKPFLRHGDKRKQLRIGLENILERNK